MSPPILIPLRFDEVAGLDSATGFMSPNISPGGAEVIGAEAISPNMSPPAG